MKQFLISIFCFLILTSLPIQPQVKSKFVPDIDGIIKISEINIESTLNWEMYDPGFTVYPGFPQQGLYTIISPKTGSIYCNLDSDSEMEIIFGAGEKLYAVNLDGSPVNGWPKTFAQYYESVWAPSFGDIDGDGEGEVVAGIGGPFGGHIQAFEKDGTTVTGFPVNVGKYPMSPTLSDLDNDGAMEIILGTRTGQAFVYKGDGTVFPGWPKQMDKYVAASASAGDVNNDGIMDVVIESRNLLYVWNKDRQLLTGFPYAIMDSLIGSNSYSAPVLADLTGDGKLEIVFCSHSDSNNAGGIIYAVKYDGTSLPGWPQTVPNWIYGAPIVADIDADSELEIIVGEYGASPTPAFYIFAYNPDGSLVNNFPMGPYHGSANQITVADIDNDNEFEIIFDENVTENGLGRYRALNLDGTEVTGWPLQLNQNTSFQQPLLGDLNNDGILDMVGGSFNFDINNKQVFLYVWNTGLPYNPTKIVNAMYQFNPQHTGIYMDPSYVPVELTSFTADLKDNRVSLNWSTATELNNYGFEIQRKLNGNEFVTIAFVKGHGTSSHPHKYNYTDKDVDEGRYSYRLKQLDYDGKFSYSQIVEVDFISVNNFMLDQNYPNPFNPITKINWQTPTGGHQTIKVFDVLGNEIVTLVDEYKPAGRHNVEFDATNLPSGVYIYQLLSGNFTQTRKMILSK